MQRYENTYVHIPHLAAAIIICEAVGALGAFHCLQAITTWYPTLAKPFFTPPDWVFTSLWLLLYGLMGAAAYRVWSYGDRWSPALSVFVAQLAVNALWSPLFFGLHSPLFGLVDLVILIVLALITLIMFYRRSRAAAGLFLPYVLWLFFALALNFEIWRMNP